MRILKYIMRQTQQSIVCEEQSEAVTIFQIETDKLDIGCVVGYHTYYKREAESRWHANSEQFAKKLKNEDISPLLDLYNIGNYLR